MEEYLSEFNMSKSRDKKVEITDIAISKVPFVKYHNFDENRNYIMQELAKDVLRLSKEENNSNEVAITCDLGCDNPLEEFGVVLGTEHEVDILADTFSNHIIVSQKSVAVVSNQGTVHYLMRDEEYDYKNAFLLFKKCIEDLSRESSTKDLYLASLSFWAKCSEAGLYYR